jgi:multicomponent Na+:H+ antiporter subunit D
MILLTTTWLFLPFFLSFFIYLLPNLDRYLSLGISILSLVYSLIIFAQRDSLNFSLLDSFGVTLLIDNLSAFFILTNALVTLAVIFYCWNKSKTAFFYAQVAIIHASVNATFISADFVSLYVALEVLSIAAFLLIAYPRSDRSLWVALRYLFLGNTVMLFYLVGVALIYREQHSFSFAGLQGAPSEALALILLALLSKGGIFISGLWLPLTHAEAESPVSALFYRG